MITKMEVFIIFPRRELAKELRICEKRVTAAIRLLIAKKLVWEKRCGRGEANQIYLAKVAPMEDLTDDTAAFSGPEGSMGSSASTQEPKEMPFKNGLDCGSGTAKEAVAEPPKMRPSYNDKNNTEESYTDVSQSVYREDMRADRLTDDESELQDILDNCDLDCLSPESALVFENAIERLFFSDSFRLGNATLPRSRLRAKLYKLDLSVLQAAERKLGANVDKTIRNSTAYVMSTLLNCVAEVESDLMVDTYLNSLKITKNTGGEHYTFDPRTTLYPASPRSSRLYST